MLTEKNFGKLQFGIKCQVGLLACVDLNFLIGYDGNLPWSHPEDLKRFKNILQIILWLWVERLMNP